MKSLVEPSCMIMNIRRMWKKCVTNEELIKYGKIRYRLSVVMIAENAIRYNEEEKVVF